MSGAKSTGPPIQSTGPPIQSMGPTIQSTGPPMRIQGWESVKKGGFRNLTKKAHNLPIRPLIRRKKH